MKSILIVAISVLGLLEASGQDFVRFNLGANLEEGSELIKEFSFDFNRTKAKKESEGRNFLYESVSAPFGESMSVYIKPSGEMNLGSKPTSSRNNVAFSVKHGLEHVLFSKVSGSNVTTLIPKIEFAPVYNASKEFDEELIYLSAGPAFTFIKEVKPAKSFSDGKFPTLKSVLSFSFGLDYNTGERISDNGFDNDYRTIGIGLSLIYRARGSNKAGKHEDYKEWDWLIIKSNLKYKKLEDESELLTTRSSVALFEISADLRIAKAKKNYINVKYQVGDFNPKYADVNALTFGLSVPF